MDLNRIMSNIYGENAPQNFDSLNLTGGSTERFESASTNRIGKIKYIDESANVSSQATYSYHAAQVSESYNNYKSLSGGSAKPKHAAKEETIYANPMLVDDEDLQKFIKEFFLHYIMANLHQNTIIIIPSSSTLKSMIADFRKQLDAEGIKPSTIEASRFAAKTELPFKNYLFDVYGNAKSNNEGFTYRVPPGFPNELPQSVIRRTNRNAKTFFFDLQKSGKYKIGTNESLSDGVTLEYVAKTNRDCWIFKGDIPVTKSKAKTVTIKADSKCGKRKCLRKKFLSLIDIHDNLDDASYEFIGSLCTDKASIDAVAKHYSGNYIHTAFSLLFDNNLNIDKIYTEMSPAELADAHSAVLNSYSPKASTIRLDKFKDALPKIHHSSQDDRSFIKNINKLYASAELPTHEFLADVATSITSRSSNIYDAVNNSFNIADEVQSPPSNSLTGGSKMYNVSLSLISNTIYNALYESPFIGSVAREYTPILLSPSKQSKSTLSGGSFEDKVGLDATKSDKVRFMILNDDDDSSSASSTDDENDDARTKDDSDDVDINSFF